MKTYVYSKDPNTDTVVELDFVDQLKFGETLVSVVIGSVTPQSDSTLTPTLQSGPSDPLAKVLLQAGDPNIAYGFQLQITTSARVLALQVAVSVTDPNYSTYTSQDPNAYTDLVDTIQAGQSAIGTAIFSFPADVDPAGGYVNWEFMDASGVVYASGNAFDYKIQSSGLSNTVVARAVINCPSNVPASAVNSKYQLRYTLTLKPLDPSKQSQYFSAENVTVVGLTTNPLGTQDVVEMRGKPAKLSIITERLYDKMVLEIYKDNTLIAQAPITKYERVANGFYYSGTVDTTNLPESLESYDVNWGYYNDVDPGTVYTETAKLWISNPSILNAVADVKARITKAHTTLYGTSDLIFPTETVMLWLRRGRDYFNGYQGKFSNISMTNAKNGIREYWLMCSEALALTSQELAEAEKAFDFQGAAISLNVDRSAAYGSMADKIQGRLDNELKPFKENLIIKGQTDGDGSADTSKLGRGAIGSVGITITPASPWGPYRTGLPYPTIGIIT
jgi:hypothetical protein